MNSQTANLLKEYFAWYEKKYSVTELEKASEILTPFKNHINDRIAIYIEYLNSGKIRITDDGVTIQELEMAGFKLTETRMNLLDSIKKDFGISQFDDELCVIAENPKDFPQKKHNLIQGILKVYDLLFTIQSKTKTMFAEDVYSFLYENEFGGTEKPHMIGASGILHHVDYSLGKTKSRPDTIFQFLGDPSFDRVAAQKYVKEDLITNKPQTKYILIGNDLNGKKIPDKSLAVAKDADLKIIPWSKKEKLLGYK
ncbi:DUF1828 domain-containing protein [Vagococcus lutrae]|uniref:DUF1828 domain-containing protein n=1 Tax=Vagococcus lutrae TaxID=81947 RepID=UPI001C95010C|nr:DUF1828 domain-containing protein [Vagococcus lutrae]QZN89142.1 DUF1828 domain-containing protein [Vagococcus lutrae]